jgi:hypothetical protein
LIWPGQVFAIQSVVQFTLTGELMKKILLSTILSLAAVQVLASNFENKLDIFVYPASRDINWKTPKKALSSFLGTEINRVTKGNEFVTIPEGDHEKKFSSNYLSTMGHTIAHVKCNLSSGAAYESWTSYSGQDSVDVDKKLVIDEKIGLGVLFHAYVDGHIISGIENVKRITYYKSKKYKPHYLSLEVDQVKCDSLKNIVEFFQNYRTLTNKNLHFSSVIDPYESYVQTMNKVDVKVGGGCAPYGAALIKAAGLYNYETDKIWKLNLSVSKKLIGGELNENNHVNILSLAVGRKGRKWDYDKYESLKINIYDPRLIWSSIENTRLCLSGENSELCTADNNLQKLYPAIRLNESSIFSDQYSKNKQPDVMITETQVVEGLAIPLN